MPERATAQPKAKATPARRSWPGRSEQDAQPSEGARQPQPSESNRQPQPSESNRQPQPSESDRQPQPLEPARRPQPSESARPPRPGVSPRPGWAVSPADRRQEARALEVSHDPEPDPRDLGEPAPAPASWPTAGAGTFPIASPFPEAGPFPEVGAFPELEPLPDPAPAPAPGPEDAPAPVRRRATPPKSAAPAAAATPVPPESVPAAPALAAPGRSMAARVASLFIAPDSDRPVPSIERALSGPGSDVDASWRRRVKVVAGGQGPGQPDRAARDRDRARLPLDGPRLIAVLGCTSGAGQSVTALLTGQVLADLREVPVAALDLNPGETSLAACVPPANSVPALLAGQRPAAEAGTGPGRGDAMPRPLRGMARMRAARGGGARLDVIAAGRPGRDGGPALGASDYPRLARLLAERYPLTLIDPAPSSLARALALADQLMLVVPASPEAATSLASTQEWLTAHGYDELAARAVTVINGVSSRTSQDVLRAESVARGRCRAIVRVPWDDLLSVRPDASASLRPQTRIAYTALAGVLVAGLAPRTMSPITPVPGRSPGGHSD